MIARYLIIILIFTNNNSSNVVNRNKNMIVKNLVIQF